MEKRIENLEKHKDIVNVFIGETKANIQNIKEMITSLKENEIRHLNQKLSWLLFLVLGSVFAAIIKIAFF